jgi:hypothetical protein
MSKKEKKTIERAERAEKDRAEKARKVQEKTDKAEKDRTEKATERERSRVFEGVLSEAGKSRGCCESCNYRVKRNGEYQPCKMGHDDSEFNKEFCADCSESRYHPKS